MTLKTRKPTGRVPWPLILVEGEEKSGKSWMCAELSASEKVGRTFWIDLGEGCADEYGAIPGARYEIVEHTGSFWEIYGAVLEIRDLAEKAQANNDLPVALVIDSMTAEWELLSAIAERKARERRARQLKRDIPLDEAVTIGTDLWNEANAKHRRLMTTLMTFPGIVAVTARGKEVVQIGQDGRPVEGRRVHKVEGQKHLGFDATVWIRLSRDEDPLVVAARSVRGGIRPGVDRARTIPGLTLEHVVFNVLGCTPGVADVRALINGTVTAADLADATEPVDDRSEFDGFAEELRVAKSPKEIEDIGKRAAATAKKGELSKAAMDRLASIAAARRAELNGGSDGDAGS